MTWRETIFAIVIAAIAGSFLQDLFLLPKLLWRGREAPMKTEPETTERSILAMVLDDMESLDLIKLSPNKKPLVEGKPQTEYQHTSEKAAA
jgi:hypothetical protein